ncbi:MAG TPA: PorP/SprF family type IX secretion system membrane protein [Chitinophagales bacterium]|nr:PorP/SprF family type IX secretion system membrane protein [Chitinophagales bacterium]HNJ90854.1 PorP/SprF family type IX secretion system membrane protein [Chitinophagales bacterium]
MLKRLFLLVVASGMLSLHAQDIHFTQFFYSPLTLNPGLTGAFNGNIRGIVNYRNQWNSFAPFNTFAASVDMNFGSSFLKNDLMGVGINAFNDVAGDTKYSSTNVGLTFAYIKTLGDRYHRSYLSAGFQGAYAQKSVDYLAMTFANQYDGVYYDPSLSNGETIGFDSKGYLDLAAGLMWYLVPKEDKFSMYLGGSIYHLNQPDQSIGAERDELYMRISGHIGAQIPVGEMTSLVPAFMVMSQGPYMEYFGGTNLKFYLEGMQYSSTAISFGIWQRIVGDVDGGTKGESTAIAARLDYGKISLGVSYDVNISSLSDASNTNGGPEISLTFIDALPRKARKIPCPKF